jgi:hypothetical protein
MLTYVEWNYPMEVIEMKLRLTPKSVQWATKKENKSVNIHTFHDQRVFFLFL